MTYSLKHNLPLQFLSQLHGHKDGGQFHQNHDAHEDGVENESGPRVAEGGGNAEEGEQEEEEANGENEIGNCGEVTVDQLEIWEEINVDHYAGEIEAGCRGDQDDQVHHTQHHLVQPHLVRYQSRWYPTVGCVTGNFKLLLLPVVAV